VITAIQDRHEGHSSLEWSLHAQGDAVASDEASESRDVYLYSILAVAA
jgi:hypothetical protein